MHYVNELIYVVSHGPFDSQEEAETWIQTQPEPTNPGTCFQVEEV